MSWCIESQDGIPGNQSLVHELGFVRSTFCVAYALLLCTQVMDSWCRRNASKHHGVYVRNISRNHVAPGATWYK